MFATLDLLNSRIRVQQASANKPPGHKKKEAEVIDLDTQRQKPDDPHSAVDSFRSRLLSRFGCPKCGCKDPDCLLTDLNGTILACIKCGFGT